MVAYLGNYHDSPIWQEIADERDRQEAIGLEKRAQGIDWRSCADPDMAGGDDKRATVLGEEFGEVCRAVLENGYGQVDEAHLRHELVQVAAVAVAWTEAIDARTASQPCAFRRAYQLPCGRPEADPVHVRPDEPMRHSAHVYRTVN